MPNPFFKNKGPYSILEILKLLNINKINFKDQNIYDVRDLISSTSKGIQFIGNSLFKDSDVIQNDAFVFFAISLYFLL